MKRYRQFEPLVISDFEVREWRHPEHNHNHYELIYIKHGAGVHIVNRRPVTYQAGDIFLVGPEEAHRFEIKTRTRFVYVKFTDLYIHQEGNPSRDSLQHIEYLIKSRETHVSGFRVDEADRSAVELLFELILVFGKDLHRNEPLIWSQVLTLAAILQRNMPELHVSVQRNKDMQSIFCYIHKYIYEPERLKAAVMAGQFNLAQDYVGVYFKRNTGITLRSYISDYRNTLIRQRLASGRYSLKQIASDFGLTDESHVSKALRREKK